MKEIWKEVPGYEGIYEVSNLGRLRSLDRAVVKSDVVQHRNGRLKKFWENQDGYLQCKLSKGGESVNIGVHRVVALAFIDNPERKPEINHKDGNRQNNVVENLEWVTHLENIDDCLTRGTHVSLRDLSGEKNPNYGNRILSHKYSECPELAVVQSRPGVQNGRARPVAVTLPDGTRLDFEYIAKCGQWLIDNGYCSVKLERINLMITKCAKSRDSYKGLTFEFI